MGRPAMLCSKNLAIAWLCGFAGCLAAPAPARQTVSQAEKQPPPPLATLEFSNIQGFLWSGEERILTFTRRQYRRADISLYRLTPDFKTYYLSLPLDTMRFGFGRTSGISASPDGRWMLGADVRGPRVFDLTTGDVQGWPGDIRAGHWLPDGTAWVEAAHVRLPGDAARQDQVERDLNSRSMEMRVYELFGDEWQNSPVRKAPFTIPYNGAVIAALDADELLIGSHRTPARGKVTLRRVRPGRGSGTETSLTLAPPEGGEISEIAVSPDRTSLAYILVRPREAVPPITLTGRSEQEYLIEVWVTPLDKHQPRLLHTRISDNQALSRVDVDSLSSNLGRPRSLQWNPNGKSIGWVVNEQIILLAAP